MGRDQTPDFRLPNVRYLEMSDVFQFMNVARDPGAKVDAAERRKRFLGN